MQCDDLLAGWRDFDDADVAVEQQIEPLCVMAFVKDFGAGLDALRCGLIQNFANFSALQATERG